MGKMKIISLILLLSSTTVGAAEPIAIVVTIKPLYAIVAAVSRGTKNEEPYLLVKKAHSPHHYRLTPNDARKIKRADVVFAVDGMLEIFLSNVQSGGRLVFMTAEDLPFLRMYNEKSHSENDHDDHNGHEEHEGVDPHVWLNPLNGARMAQIVADALSKIDQNNAKVYQRNAASLRQQLIDVDAEIALQLMTLSTQSFLTFHDAYGYFSDRYSLSYHSALSLSGVIRSRSFWQLKQNIAKEDIVCVMTEPQFLSDAVTSLVADSNIKVGYLDPLGADIPLGDGFYLLLLRQMAQSFTDCLTAE